MVLVKNCEVLGKPYRFQVNMYTSHMAMTLEQDLYLI